MVEGVALHRLRWKCRRGLLELDLVLQRYLEHGPEEGDMAALNELLEMPDNDLWDIVSGRSDRFERRYHGIVARLRAV